MARTKEVIKESLKEDLNAGTGLIPYSDEKTSALIQIVELLEKIEENTRK